MKSRILKPSTLKLVLALAAVAVLLAAAPLWQGAAAGPEEGNWTMWGGGPGRNMASAMKGLPAEWDIETGRNIKWVAELGSQTYGNPVVAGGMVFVGTNNEGVKDPGKTGDQGVLMAFRESDGEFLWQMVNEKLASGRANDWPYQGVCSSPLVEGDRLYYVNNRGQVIALDIHGFRDGENDGPYQDETETRDIDPDILWIFDMMEEVGAFQHNMANSSPVVYGGLIFVGTSNGQDESHVNVPSPLAPDLIALNKNTGELVWEDQPAGESILHGQWSAPAVGEIGGVAQVVMGEGDGWVRGYQAMTGEQLWEFDTNPKDSVWPKTRNNIISTPVIFNNVVYLANGQDPEHGEGVGHLYAIDGTKRGDITETGRLWHYGKIRRSISTGAIHNGLLYYADFSGFLHALDIETGEPVWVHDTLAAVWGSPMIIDGKLYLGDEDGDVIVLESGREEKPLAEMNLGSSVYSTPVPANGTLFITTRNRLFALAIEK